MEQRSMNKVTDKELQRMMVPTVAMEQHQVHLKQALLAASYPANKTAKTRWSNLMRYTKKPKFIVSGLTMAFAAVAIVAFSTFTSLGSVSAAELTQQSLDKVSQLSPTAQKALDERVNGDPKAELRAARSAKDLEILTYDQFKNLSLGGPNNITVHGPNGGTAGPDSLDPSSLKYLKYTDASGATHIIGVDKNGLPSLIMVFRDKDGTQSGSVMVTGGGHGAGTMTMGTGPVSGDTNSGMSSCTAVAGGQPTCTSSGGGSPTCQTDSDGKVTCMQTSPH
jgi:hypothetical protein